MQQPENSLFHQWRKGLLADQPATATVVLAVALVLTLFGAQMLVWSRGPAFTVSPEARNAGQELIKKVQQDGLDKYLGRHPIVRYMIHKKAGQPISYSALFFQPVLKGDTVIFAGRDIHIQPDKKLRTETEFTIANDLSKYEFSFQQYLANRQMSARAMQYHDGDLLLTNRKGRYQKVPLDQLPHTENLIPPMLLDFFSSLAARQNPDSQTAFLFPDILNVDPEQIPILFLDCTVKNYDQVPKDVLAAHPDAKALEVIWSGDMLIEPMKQHILYDENHQIVWQQENDPDDILTAVDEQQLNELFPGSANILEQWLRIYLYDQMELL